MSQDAGVTGAKGQHTSWEQLPCPDRGEEPIGEAHKAYIVTGPSPASLASVSGIFPTFVSEHPHIYPVEQADQV